MRRRFFALLAALLLIPLGLLTRSGHALVPGLVAEHGGDALWAAMVYALWVVLLPRAGVGRAVALAGLFSLGIELSQLSQAEWLVTLRADRFARLVLGQGFQWADLVRYAVGIAAAAGVDAAAQR